MISARVHNDWVMSYPERVVVYICLAGFITKLVFELGLGLWWYKLSTTTLLIFLILLAVDHAFWLAKGGFKGIPADRPMLVLVVFWFLMTLHGALVGWLQGQSVVSIIDDTVPVLLCLLSLIRFGLLPAIDYTAAFRRISRVIYITAISSTLIGIIAVSLGLPSRPSPGTHVFAMLVALQFVALAKVQFTLRFWGGAFIFWFVFVASIEDINRSTLASIGGLFVLALLLRLRFDIRGGLTGLLMAALFPFVLLATVPEGSKTYVRLYNIINSDEGGESVSLNSRKLEKQQIEAQLQRNGFTTELLGLGHGATYEYSMYGKTELEHGHAHYASAYMQLRYGAVGTLYVYGLAVSVVLGSWLAIRNGSSMALFMGALNLTAFIYLFTWVNFFFYFMGLTYLVYSRGLRSWIDTKERSTHTADKLGQLSAEPV